METSVTLQGSISTSWCVGAYNNKIREVRIDLEGVQLQRGAWHLELVRLKAGEELFLRSKSVETPDCVKMAHFSLCMLFIGTSIVNAGCFSPKEERDYVTNIGNPAHILYMRLIHGGGMRIEQLI